MRKYLLYIILFFSTYILYVFFNALKSPLNNINPLLIAAVLYVLFLPSQENLLAVILFGLMKDGIDHSFIGLSSLVLVVALFTIRALRSSLISHQTHLSLLLFILLFNAIYFSSMMFLNMYIINTSILQETLGLILINAFVCFFLFIAITTLKRQYAKRFW